MIPVSKGLAVQSFVVQWLAYPVDNEQLTR